MARDLASSCLSFCRVFSSFWLDSWDVRCSCCMVSDREGEPEMSVRRWRLGRAMRMTLSPQHHHEVITPCMALIEIVELPSRLALPP